MTTTSAGEVQEVQAYQCLECNELSEDAGEALYECGDCGEKFNRDDSADGMSHRCPDCNRFSAKIADQSCGVCGQGEVEEVAVYKCPECDALHELETQAKGCCAEEPETGTND